MSSIAQRVDVPAAMRALNIECERRGRELWARCPLPGHAERTPSWSIKSTPGRSGNGYHKCWGCEGSGGVVDLVRMLVGLGSLKSAVDWLLDRGFVVGESAPAGLSLASVGGFARPTLTVPRGVELEPLANWTTVARRYAERRGITAGQVERWGLGYAVDGEMAGRLFIPARDRTGRIASYTGRSLFNRDPKYKDAEADGNADRSVLFGEQHWPADVSGEALYLFEGELNALAAERVGARCVGGLGGSGLHREQNLKIARFGRVVIGSDPDKAGSKVALHLRAALGRWRNVVRAQFPGSADANDIERASPQQLRGILFEAHG